MIKGVIFDMDGVVVDSMPLHARAWQKFLSKYGISLTEKELGHYAGMINTEIFAVLLPNVSKKEYPALAEEKESYYFESARGSLKPVPGVVDFIKELKAHGYLIAIGSGGSIRNVRFSLGELGILGCFDAFSTSEDVSMGKPDPEVFIKAAQKLGLAPSECIVIEDSHLGIEAAKRAGMKAIGITTTHDPAKLKESDVIISSFSELSVDDMKVL